MYLGFAVLGGLVFGFFGGENFHLAPSASGQRTTFQNQNFRPFPSSGRTKWEGYFSAKNFNDSAAVLELSKLRKNINRVFGVLPRAHLSRLETLELRHQKNLSRGMANDRKIILHTRSIGSEKELAAVLLHEVAHVVDLGLFSAERGEVSAFRDGQNPIFRNDPSVDFYSLSWKNQKERRSSAVRADFVSGYAMQTPFEDFAETYVFYRLHGEKFRALAKNSAPLAAKYEFFKTRVFENREFQTQKFLTPNFNILVWDATLLPFSDRDLAN